MEKLLHKLDSPEKIQKMANDPQREIGTFVHRFRVIDRTEALVREAKASFSLLQKNLTASSCYGDARVPPLIKATRLSRKEVKSALSAIDAREDHLAKMSNAEPPDTVAAKCIAIAMARPGFEAYFRSPTRPARQHVAPYVDTTRYGTSNGPRMYVNNGLAHMMSKLVWSDLASVLESDVSLEDIQQGIVSPELLLCGLLSAEHSRAGVRFAIALARPAIEQFIFDEVRRRTEWTSYTKAFIETNTEHVKMLHALPWTDFRQALELFEEAQEILNAVCNPKTFVEMLILRATSNSSAPAYILFGVMLARSKIEQYLNRELSHYSISWTHVLEAARTTLISCPQLVLKAIDDHPKELVDIVLRDVSREKLTSLADSKSSRAQAVLADEGAAEDVAPQDTAAKAVRSLSDAPVSEPKSVLSAFLGDEPSSNVVPSGGTEHSSPSNSPAGSKDAGVDLESGQVNAKCNKCRKSFDVHTDGTVIEFACPKCKHYPCYRMGTEPEAPGSSKDVRQGNRGGRSGASSKERLKRKLQVKIINAMEKQWPKLWDSVFEMLNKIVQLLVLSAATHLTELFKTLGYTRWALKPQTDTCGFDQDDTGEFTFDTKLNRVNSIMAEYIFLIWIVAFMWPLWVFYMPLLFSKRSKESSETHGKGKRYKRLAKIMYLMIGIPLGMIIGILTHLPLVPLLMRLLKCFKGGDQKKKKCRWRMPSMNAVKKEILRSPFHDLLGGLLSVLYAYIEVLVHNMYAHLRRLILLTCGIWTEDLLLEYRILERAAKVHKEQRSRLGGAWTGEWKCLSCGHVNGIYIDECEGPLNDAVEEEQLLPSSESSESERRRKRGGNFCGCRRFDHGRPLDATGFQLEHQGRQMHRSYLEDLCKMTAKLHAMFWLTIPGMAILTKMAEYLNAHPTWFVTGQTYSGNVMEIDSAEDLPKIEYQYVCGSKEEVREQELITCLPSLIMYLM